MHRSANASIVVGITLVCAALAACGDQSATVDKKTTSDAKQTAPAGNAPADENWFTAQQAEQGHEIFNNHCAECHRPDLTGALGPALVGKPFKQHWGGLKLQELYDFEHKNMPASAPGTMTEEQLLPITAYILQKNGLPEGKGPLTATDLPNLTIPK